VEQALNFVCHDKKCLGEFVSAIFVETIGSFEIKKINVDEFKIIIKNYFNN
jgi:3-dehydroquinate synthetase